MHYKYNENDSNAKNPIRSQLFTDGFVNDDTTLDAYNLNLILKAFFQLLGEGDHESCGAPSLKDCISQYDTIVIDGLGVPIEHADKWNGQYEGYEFTEDE